MKRAEWVTLSALKWRGCGFLDRVVRTDRSKASALLTADAGALARAGLSAESAAKLVAARRRFDVTEHLAGLAKHGLTVTTPVDPEWPEALSGVEDPPFALYHRGPLPGPDRVAVAIVGTRSATWYGLDVARRMARELAEAGVLVISGLAYGVDAAAHAGALEAERGALAPGGVTLAVLAAGPERAYPSAHDALYARIVANGAAVSEAPPGTATARHLFPLRNRLVSGLACAVVVVEAPLGSGALITAERAQDQGRDILVVPGPVTSPACAGSNALLKSRHAQAVTGAADVLLHCGLQPLDAARPAEALDAESQRLVKLLSPGPLHVDRLIEAFGVPPGRLHRLLVELEAAGVLFRLPGSRWARTTKSGGVAEFVTAASASDPFREIEWGVCPSTGSSNRAWSRSPVSP